LRGASLTGADKNRLLDDDKPENGEISAWPFRKYPQNIHRHRQAPQNIHRQTADKISEYLAVRRTTDRRDIHKIWR